MGRRSSTGVETKAVAYINSDGNGRGFIGASGSHTLETFFNEIADNVIDPGNGSNDQGASLCKTGGECRCDGKSEDAQ
jgi:hypothetical protein